MRAEKAKAEEQARVGHEATDGGAEEDEERLEREKREARRREAQLAEARRSLRKGDRVRVIKDSYACGTADASPSSALLVGPLADNGHADPADLQAQDCSRNWRVFQDLAYESVTRRDECADLSDAHVLLLLGRTLIAFNESDYY